MSYGKTKATATDRVARHRRAWTACVHLLTRQLSHVRGVEKAHVVADNGTAELCVHYNPNLVSLGQIQRIAVEAGAEVTARYRHEQIPFTGLDAADSATTLAQALEALPGMLHASVGSGRADFRGL